MKYFFYFIIILYASFLSANDKLNIICTTTDLSSMILAIGKDSVTVNTIVPYGMCPGHIDVSPREISQIKKADLVLAHGFERFLSDIISGDEIKITIIETEENLMIPANHSRTAQEIANILINEKPELKSFFTKNLDDYNKNIIRIEKELLEKISILCNKDVICASMNKPFVEWLGSNVIAVFPRDEDISLKSINDIISNARKNNPILVIDNLQSSGKVGQTIAEELELPLVIVSNFPENDDYIITLQNNCSKIVTSFNEQPGYESRH